MSNVARNSASAKKQIRTTWPFASAGELAFLRISIGGPCRITAVTPAPTTLGQNADAENFGADTIAAPATSAGTSP
jgi:hypothetical protein